MYYEEYKYYKDGDKTQKPEKCNYWSRDAALEVSKELERLIDYSTSLDSFRSLSTSGMTIIVGADQGQGAWHSWLTINTMSVNKIEEQMGNDDYMIPKQAIL